MGYRKPTIVETYAELHLAPDTLTESRFFDVVPALKQAGFTNVELATGGLSIDIKRGPFPRETQRVRCWKPGKTELAQVGEDLLILNLTGAYPGWDAFLRLFGEGRGALEAGLGPFEVRSLNLFTVDRIDATKEGFAISQYLDVEGGIVPAWFQGCRESLDLNMGRGLLEPDGHNRQVHIGVQAAIDPVKITIQCSFHDLVERGENLRNLLGRLHAEATDTFESLITDHVRDVVMEGRDA